MLHCFIISPAFPVISPRTVVDDLYYLIQRLVPCKVCLDLFSHDDHYRRIRNVLPVYGSDYVTLDIDQVFTRFCKSENLPLAVSPSVVVVAVIFQFFFAPGIESSLRYRYASCYLRKHFVGQDVFYELPASVLVLRTQYDEMPVRVEYSLTDKAKTIIPILLELKRWGEVNL